MLKLFCVKTPSILSLSKWFRIWVFDLGFLDKGRTKNVGTSRVITLICHLISISSSQLTFQLAFAFYLSKLFSLLSQCKGI